MKDFDFEKLEEFDNHKLVQFIFDRTTGLRGFIAIHRVRNYKPSLGATRLWRYATEIDALKDALLLSKAMSYKSALAGLPYGGAKAVLIFSPKVKKDRRQFFTSYAKKLNDLGGKFITGTDVGVEDRDVKTMKAYTPYVIGTKVEPAFYTAVGVYYGIQEALRHFFGSKDVRGRSFALQGVGKTGLQILKMIYPAAGKIFIADIDKQKVKKAKRRFPRVKIASPASIIRQRVDVFSPCAIGGVLNSKNTTYLRAKIVAGSANNQLKEKYVDSLLYKLGILYVPDYVINAGGLISVVDEMEHKKPSKKKILQKIAHIPETLKSIFNKSTKERKPTGLVANQLAKIAVDQ